MRRMQTQDLQPCLIGIGFAIPGHLPLRRHPPVELAPAQALRISNKKIVSQEFWFYDPASPKVPDVKSSYSRFFFYGNPLEKKFAAIPLLLLVILAAYRQRSVSTFRVLNHRHSVHKTGTLLNIQLFNDTNNKQKR
jgi:hypothetical protein